MQMPIITSHYWNMVHGAKPEDVKKDLEGMQTMQVLAKNMAFFLKCNIYEFYKRVIKNVLSIIQY